MSINVKGDRPQIYIAGALTDAKEAKLGTYKDIRDGCDLAGFDSYLPHEDTGARTDNLDPGRVFAANISAVDRSVAVVAEVSVASHGVGIEIEHAHKKGMPVIAIAHQRADVSRMLLGHPELKKRGVLRYNATKQVSALVKKALETGLRGVGTLRNRLISIEGPDFVGKSEVCRYLNENASSALSMPVTSVTDPPWHLEPWTQLNPIFRDSGTLSPAAVALLFGTARVDNYARMILPALARGDLVVCDRYIDSWFAYQSVKLSQQGFKFPLEFLLSQQTLLEGFEAVASPGLTILLTASSEELEQRAATRSERSRTYEQKEFLEFVVRTYDRLHERFPFRIARFDTTGRSIDSVCSLVLETIKEYVTRQP
jgi:dTMP kinase